MPIRILPKTRSGSLEIETTEENPHLTKEDLLKLYYLSSEYLHVGSFANLADRDQKDYSLTYADIKLWHNKIVTLIDNHVVWTIDEEYALHNSISRSETGRVLVHLTSIVRVVARSASK